MKFSVPLFFILLFGISEKTFSQHTIDSLSQLVDSLSHQSLIEKDDSQRLLQLNRISLEIYMADFPDKKLKMDEATSKALDLARNISQKKGLAEALLLRGKFEISLAKEFYIGTRNFLESKRIFEILNDSSGISRCYTQLGLISFKLKYYEDAIKSLNESLRFNTIENQSRGRSNYLTALSYLELNDSINALMFFNNAIKVYEKLNYKSGLIQCYTYMAKLYVMEGNIDRANNFFNKVFNYYQSTEDRSGLGRILSIQSISFYKSNNFLKAIEVGLQAYAIGKELNDENTLIESGNTLYKSYFQLRDFKNSFLFLNELKMRNDSVYNINSSQRIAEMKSRDEFDKELYLEKQKEEKRGVITQKEIEKQIIIRNSLAALFIVALFFAAIVFVQRRKISKEKIRSEDLLLNILPEYVAEELKTTDKVHAQQYDLVSVLFTDFVEFTKISAELSAKEIVSSIDFYFSTIDQIISKYNIEKIKTIGDAYMCASGVPKPNPSHAVDLVTAALEIQNFVNSIEQKRKDEGNPAFKIRCGIHSGPVVAGVVGTKKFAYDIWGDTVNIAARMETAGETDKVNISGTTYELVKHKFNCTHRGKIEAKNRGEVDMYFVEGLK